MLEDGLGLPNAPQAIPLGQGPWAPAPAHPPARIPNREIERAPDEIIDEPQRSFPWAPRDRPARQKGPSLLGQDSSMEEAPPVQLKGANEAITQPGLKNGRPAFWAPNDRPARCLPFGHDSAMAEAPPASSSNPRDRTDQLRMPVPPGPRSDVRPAPSFIPASATQSGPAFPHGIANQPKMPVPTGPRSSMGHVMNNQPRLPVPTASASQVCPAPPPYLAATPSGPASAQARLGQPGMPVPTAPESDIFQAPRTLPASAAPSSPASLDPRRWPGAEARAQKIGSAHSSNPDPRRRSNSSIFHDSGTVEAPSCPASLAQQIRPVHEQISASDSGPAHNLPRNAARQSSSSTFPNSARVNDSQSVGRGLDETRTTSTPEGASSSTRIPQSHPAQSFAQAPPTQAAQASQKGSHSPLLSSQSDQIPGLSSAPDSTQASLSQRSFKIIRMRIMENAVTVRSGYALFWD